MNEHDSPADKDRPSKVGIYCRISAGGVAQLKKLSEQLSALARYAAAHDSWRLSDIYLDMPNGRNRAHREEFERMSGDCAAGRLDIILLKNLGCLGSSCSDILAFINDAKQYGARVIAVDDNAGSGTDTDHVIISAINTDSPAEKGSRSANIRRGLAISAALGTSRLFNRKCYGYDHDEDGDLIINEEEARIVPWIFDAYLSGQSIVSIIRQLREQGVKSPAGKDTWYKRAIETMLHNEKYIGDTILFKGSGRDQYALAGKHPPIVSRETFEAVQNAVRQRSRRNHQWNGEV